MQPIEKNFWGAIFVIFLLTVLMGGYIGLATPSLAGSPNLNQVLPSTPSNVPIEFSSIQLAIGTIFNVVIIIAGTIFVILFLIGGIMYLTGAGNEEATGKAKKLMVDAIIGLVLTLAAWAIGMFLLGRLGFTGSAIPGSGGPVSSGVPGFPRQVSTQLEFGQAVSDCRSAGRTGLVPGGFTAGATYNCV